MGVTVTAQDDGSVLLAIKVVPGASRERIVGPLGEALKVATAAAPEAGKANRAVCRLLAKALGVAARRVTVHHGPGSARKTLRIEGLGAAEVRAKLHLA